MAFDEPVYEEDLKLKGIFRISRVGRVFTIITDEYDEEFIKSLEKFKPLFIEEIDLSLEDIFIYKVDKEDNDEKYLNKGLLYAWFNSAKAAIAIGLLVWGAVAYEIIKSNLNDVRNRLANNFDNYYYTNVCNEYFMLSIIFVAIYFIAKGINKRNTEMFLCSGPYTKKQIRYNEFICLLITLILFVITYIYIAIVSYFGNAEFISIMEGYWNIVIIETSK